MFWIVAIVDALPFGHLGEFRGLAVDRPRRAVVVRLAGARLVVDVSENLESEFGIFVECLETLRHVVTAMRAHEIRIGEQLFKQNADLFAAFSAWIARQDGAAIGNELVEFVCHCRSPIASTSLIGEISSLNLSPSARGPQVRAAMRRSRCRAFALHRAFGVESASRQICVTQHAWPSPNS